MNMEDIKDLFDKVADTIEGQNLLTQDLLDMIKALSARLTTLETLFNLLEKKVNEDD